MKSTTKRFGLFALILAFVISLSGFAFSLSSVAKAETPESQDDGFTLVSTVDALQSAIKNAVDGDTITLTSDITLTEGIVNTKKVTLDLANYTIKTVITEKLTKSFAMITNKGDLTITGTGKISVEYTNESFGYGIGLYAINNGATLTVESGTIENLATVSGSMYDAIDNNSTNGDTILNVNGGEINCAYIAIRQFANSNTNKNVVNVTGGSINGGNCAIWTQNPSSTSKEVSAEIAISDGTFAGRILLGESENFDIAISGGTYDRAVAEEYCAEGFIPVENADGTFGIKEEPQGSVTYAYTSQTAIWGEGGGNAKESLVVSIYENDTVIATASLNNIDGILNGNVYVTWNIPFAGSNDPYWNVAWAEGYPNVNMSPTKVTMTIDGVEVAENLHKWNAPDDLNKIVALSADANGESFAAYISLADAINAGASTIRVISSVEESFTALENVTIIGKNVTITNTYSDDYVDFNNVTLGNGVTLNIPNVYSSGSNSVNVIEGTLNVGSTYYHSSNAKTTIQNGGKVTTGGMTVVRYNTNANAGLYIIGDGNSETVEFACANTLGAYSGTLYAEDADIQANMIWLDYKKDSTEESDSYAAINANFVDSSVNVTSEFRLYKDANLTLEGANVTAGKVQIRENATPVVNVDENTTIKATTVENLSGATINAQLGEDGTVSFVSMVVAEVNGVTYTSLVDAAAAATAGDTIKLLADVTLTETLELPAGIKFNGNEFTVNGTIKAGGDLEFIGQTIVATFNPGWYNNTITIGEGASLKATTGRMTVSYGNVFNITGSVDNAKNADKTVITPSLELVAGLSFNGDGAGVQFNVTNAYVVLGDSTTKNSGATGEFNLNINNSIVDFTKTLKTYMPTVDGLAPVFNMTAKDSVINFASHLELWLDGTTLTLDNTNLTVGGSFANAGTLNLTNGANFVVKAPIMSSHGGNTGTINVDGATFELVDSNEAWQNAGIIKVNATGKVVVNDFACVNEGKIVVDATGLEEGESKTVITYTADTNNIENIVTVENGDGVVVSYDGYVTIEKKFAVAVIGETKYYTLQSAIDAAKANEEVELLCDVELTETLVISADKAIVLNLAGFTISAEKACTAHFEMIKNNGELTITGNGIISFKDTGAGDNEFGWGSYTVGNYGVLVVENGTIRNLTDLNTPGNVIHMYSAIQQGSGITTINGGVISTPTYRSVRINRGELVINGGEFEGQVWVQPFGDGIKVEIKGGKFAPSPVDGSSVFITNNTKAVSLAISGGEFTTKIGCSNATALAGAITGGLFSAAAVEKTNSALLANGFIFVENADGTFGVQEMQLELEGDGTENNPYQIATLDGLKNFRDMVNAGNDYAGKYFKMTADIDLNETSAVSLFSSVVEDASNWTPIGTKENPFKGTFDGAEFTVSNLVVSGTTNVGYFGYADNATIKNLTIVNATVNGTDCVGAIAGQVYSVSLIDNCHVSGNIQITGQTNVGGIVGKYYTKVTNCSVIGDGVDSSFVKGVYVASDLEGDNVGGIMGHCGEDNSLTNNTVKNITISGTRKVGGIVGIADQNTDVQNCIVDNVVIETTATADYANSNVTTMSIGGLIGQYQTAGSSVDGTVTGSAVSNVVFNNVNNVTVAIGPVVGGARGGSTGMLAPSNMITTENNAIDMESITGANNDYLLSFAAKIGDAKYLTLAQAFAALVDGDTLEILEGEFAEGAIKLPATLKNVTIKGAANNATVLKDMTIMAYDGNSISYERITFDGIVFDNSRISVTGWRSNGATVKDITITNCIFKNLNDTTNSAPVHFNMAETEPVNNFTFTNNVIDGATGGSKSGVYLQATGKVLVENNVINNVAFRPFVVQITTDDGIADEFTVTGNTFSGSSVGRAQGLGNNGAGTDTVDVAITNNIFKDITNAQQICYWNFNDETTTTDLSGNYFDIDIEANPDRIYYNGACQNTNDLYDVGLTCYYTELNEDGTINEDSEVEIVRMAAQIGDVVYSYLDEAVQFLKENGGTLVLLADGASITLNDKEGVIANKKPIVIDLNGYTLTSGESTLWVSDGYDVTIQDSSADKTGEIISTASAGEAIAIARGGKVTLESGYIYNGAYAVYLYGGDATGEETFVMNGGTVEVANGGMTIAVGSGKAIINDGAIICNKVDAGWSMYAYVNGQIEINGGNITGVVGRSTDQVKVEIKGGRFTFVEGDNFIAGTIPAGYYVNKVSDGVYDVLEVTEENAMVKVGDVLFLSIADAMAYAKDNGITDLVITIIGANDSSSVDTFDLAYGTAFDNVTIKQDNGNVPYYVKNIKTGDRTAADGKFVFDGVNIVSTGNIWFECDVVLTNNSILTRSNDSKNFVFYGTLTIEPGSKFISQIDDVMAGELIVDGGRTDGAYNEEVDYSSIYVDVRAGQTLTIKNGAYVLFNAANEIGRLSLYGNINITDSKLDVFNNIVLGDNACLNINVNSLVTAKTIEGAGVITIDATGLTDEKTVIKADLSGFTGIIEVVDGEYEIVGNTIVVKEKAVAKIGENTYATLQAAFDAANAGDVVTLISNVTLAETTTLAEGKDIILDLADYTITTVNDTINMVINGKLTIKDSVGDGKSIVRNHMVYGELVLESGTLKNIETAAGGFPINAEGGKVTINGGSVIAENQGNYAIKATNNAEITIYDVVAEGNWGVVHVSGNSKAIINGGMFEVTGAIGGHAVYVADGGEVTINGGTFTPYADEITSYAIYANNNGQVTVTGGTFGAGLGGSINGVGTIKVSGGSFASDPSAFVAEGYCAIKNFSNLYVVGATPTATVNDLGAMVIPEAEYIVYGGTKSGDMPLSFVMQFLADQTEQDMATSPYADWYGDFVITFTGLENGSFTANGCYLAGYYGSFGWVKVPVDGMSIEEGARYPVMLGVGMGQKYDYICSDVKDFRCAMYLTDDILADNPNLKVSLELSVVDNSAGEDAAANALADANSTYTHKVGVTKYVAEDFVAPVAKIGSVGYATLADALTAAVDDDTVTLLEDVALESALTIKNKEVTIDLNGKTISGICNASQGYLICVDNTASLTVKDSSEDESGKITYAQGSSNVGWTIYVLGEFVLESGTIELTGSWSIGYAVEIRPNAWGTAYENPSIFTMNGGNVISSDAGVRVASSSSDIYENVSATFVMNGGKIDAAWDGVFIQQSDVAYDTLAFKINGGTIESDSNPVRVYGPAPTSYVKDQNCMNITFNGGTLTYTGTETRTWIIDGVLRVGNSMTGEILVENGDVVVTETAVSTMTLAEGFKWVDNADGTYSMVAKTYVAEVNGAKYESLQEAIDAAQADNTITLLTDLEIASDFNNAAKGLFNIAADDKITIDLNGKIINVTDNSNGNFIVFYSYGELTIKNGTVKVTSTNNRLWNAQSTVILNRGGVLNVESGTYEHLGGTDMAITVDNSGNSFGDAVLNVNGGEIKSTYIGIRNRMADTTMNGNPGNGTATINVTGGYIYGFKRGIWGQITNPYAGELGALTITGGTIEGETNSIIIASDSNANVAIAISGDAIIKGALSGDETDYAIAGGTFTVEVPEGYCAEGYAPVANADGTYGVSYVGVFKFSAWSLTLKGDIGVNFKAVLNEELKNDPEAYFVRFTVNGEERARVYVAEATIETDTGFYVFTINMAAAELTQTITVEMCDSAETVYDSTMVVNRTIKDYIDGELKKTNIDAEEKNLMIALLNYGARAQLLFDYDEDNLANAGLSDNDKDISAGANFTTTDMSHSDTDANDGIKANSASLLLQSLTTIRVKFAIDDTVDLTAYKFMVDGVEVEAFKSGSLYSVDIKDIESGNLDKQYTVTIVKVADDTTVLTLRYSALNYVQATLKNTNSSAENVELAKALQLYNKAANEYFE